MKWEEFYFLLFNKDLKLLIIIFILNFLSLLLLFRKNINNLFDPLNIMIINLSACFTIFIYLFLEKLIINKYFYQLISINIFMIISLKMVLFYKKIIIFKKKLNIEFFKIYYKIHTIIFSLTVIYFYKLININLMTNKLNAFENLGLLRHSSNFLFPGQLILILIKREIYGYKSKIDYLIYIIIFILFFFSGGKTATITYFLYFFSTLYFLNIIQKNILYKRLKKYSLVIFIFSFIGVIIIFSIVSDTNNLEIILKKIINRIFSSGDIYYMSYVNNNVNKIKVISLFYYYVVAVIGSILRKIMRIQEYIYPGFQIIEVIYGVKTNSFGPNTRYDLVLQMNLGYFGVIGGVLSGILMGIIRKIKTLNFIFLETIIILFVNFETIIIDFGIFGSYIFSCIFMLSILIPTSYFIYKILGSYKK